MYVALVTPFEVGFLEPATSPTEVLFLVNRGIDVIFVVDLILQFFIMVEINTGDEVRWVMDQRTISLHYLRGWFIIDLTSIAVSAFDYLNFFVQVDVENFRLLRMLRALRLVKLVKLLTGLKIIKRYEVKMVRRAPVLISGPLPAHVPSHTHAHATCACTCAHADVHIMCSMPPPPVPSSQAINYAALSLFKCIVGMLLLSHCACLPPSHCDG